MTKLNRRGAFRTVFLHSSQFLNQQSCQQPVPYQQLSFLRKVEFGQYGRSKKNNTKFQILEIFWDQEIKGRWFARLISLVKKILASNNCWRSTEWEKGNRTRVTVLCFHNAVPLWARVLPSYFQTIGYLYLPIAFTQRKAARTQSTRSTK